MSMHHDVQMEAATGHDHHQHQMAQEHQMAQAVPAPESQPRHGDHAHGVTDLCKCLNCNMCTTPAVSPFVRGVQPERRSYAVSYSLTVTGDRPAPVFVDPGIPIRMA